MILNLQNIKPTSFECQFAPNTIWGNDIQWDIQKIYQIIATSGSGKTTLVSILAGLRGDYTGDIILNDRSFKDYSVINWSQWRSCTASFVFQDLRLFPELSVWENIQLSSELSTKHVLDVEGIRDYVRHLGLDEKKLKVPVKHISLGQSQRIAIIRALSRNYSWIILDEPFSHLDHRNAERAWELIKQDAAAKNAGIIITSLDPYPFIKPDHSYQL